VWMPHLMTHDIVPSQYSQLLHCGLSLFRGRGLSWSAGGQARAAGLEHAASAVRLRDLSQGLSDWHAVMDESEKSSGSGSDPLPCLMLVLKTAINTCPALVPAV